MNAAKIYCLCFDKTLHGSGLGFGVGCLFLLSSRLKFRLSQAAKNNNTNKSVIHRMIYIDIYIYINRVRSFSSLTRLP